MIRTPITVIALAIGLHLAPGLTRQAAALDGGPLKVSLTSISGDAGHAFVYAQVTDSTAAWSAPNGIAFASPFYSIWRVFPVGATNCPWIWAVYVFDKATNRQLNASPPGAPGLNFHTTTLFCPSASATPIGVPRIEAARARLDLDLQISVDPDHPVTGGPATLVARLRSSLTSDLSLYLNMAITDWTVTRWTIDFGDAHIQTAPGSTARDFRVDHTFSAQGLYVPRVVANIAGHAQAARFALSGDPFVLRRSFVVTVANSTAVRVGRTPARTYHAPQVEGRVTPRLNSQRIPFGPAAFRHVEVLRGALTDFAVRPALIQDAFFTVDGVRAGGGHSVVTAWRYTGPPTDAQPGLATQPQVWHTASEVLRLQWNRPNRLANARPQDYSVPLALMMRTVYADGHVANHVIPSTFTVTVHFTAQDG